MMSKKSFSLPLYLFLVFALSWPFFILKIWVESLIGLYVLSSLAMIMVGVATFIYAKWRGEWPTGWSSGKLWHYLSVILLAFAIWGIPRLIDLILGYGKFTEITGTTYVLVSVFLFVTLIPAFGEEFGWRGYLLPKLMERYSTRKSVLLHSVIWWAWHLPMLVTGLYFAGSEGGDVGVTMVIGLSLSAVVSIFVGVTFAYVWLKTRSIAVATVYHAAYDGIRDSFGIMVTGGLFIGLGPSFVTVLLGVIMLCCIKKRWAKLN